MTPTDDDRDPATSTAPVSTPGAGADSEPNQVLVGRLDEVVERLGRLEATTGRLSRSTDEQQQVILRLHEENQRLRRGEVEQAIAPLVRHLVELTDQIRQVATHLESAEADRLRVVERGILEGLRRAGVESRPTQPGDEFDPQRHYALGVRDTDDPTLDERVAEVRTELFAWAADGRVLRPAQVLVHRAVTSQQHTKEER